MRSEFSANLEIRAMPRYMQSRAPAKGYNMHPWLYANAALWFVVLPLVARFN